MRDTWRSSRDSNPSGSGSPGIDRVTAQQFSSDLERNLKDIRSDLRDGKFAFRRLRIAPVPKASGGERIVAIPTVRDRLVQRCLLRHLESVSRFKVTSDISYGFAKGRTLQDAQRRALALRNEHSWVVKADIVQFFDNIERSQIAKIVSQRVRSKVVRALLLNAISAELDETNPKGLAIARENGIRRGVGLRQGMPVSPMLSNLLLRQFDIELGRKGILALRYADDIALFAKSRCEGEQGLSVVRSMLKSQKLNIPELAEGGKTTITEPLKAVEFLGVELRRVGDRYELRAPNKTIAKVDRRLAEICNAEYCIKEKLTLPRILRSVESMLIGYDHALAIVSDHEEFKSRIRASGNQNIRQLLISIFGEKVVRELSPEKLAIIGIVDFT